MLRYLKMSIPENKAFSSVRPGTARDGTTVTKRHAWRSHRIAGGLAKISDSVGGRLQCNILPARPEELLETCIAIGRHSTLLKGVAVLSEQSEA